MNKLSVTLMSCIFLLTFIVTGTDAWMNKGQAHLIDFTKGSHLIGAKVANRQMEDLGEISDIVLDTRDGRITFVLLSPDRSIDSGDRLIAVPLTALSLLDENHVILDISKEKLAKAPGFDKNKWPNMSSREWVGDAYKFYGIRPYWEDDGMKK